MFESLGVIKGTVEDPSSKTLWHINEAKEEDLNLKSLGLCGVVGVLGGTKGPIVWVSGEKLSCVGA